MSTTLRRTRAASLLLVVASVVVAALVAAACSDTTSKAAAPAGVPTTTPGANRTLKISAIPDQDPAKLANINQTMATYLAAKLGVKVEFVPVTDYAASVSLFKTGDLDLVFFGGLTGVQARLQTPGSVLVAQRDIDDAFRSVFIASTSSGIQPIGDVGQLTVLKGKRFTFGSESSTSGRLMPEFFLDQAGISSENGFSGPAGYSGSHDKTIDLVQAGTYDAGALNAQVWKTRKEKGTVDLTKVTEVLTSPSYHDYHWVAGPKTNEHFGAGFTDKLTSAFTSLDGSIPEQANLLSLYGAKSFIPTKAENYREIEQIGRKLKLIT